MLDRRRLIPEDYRDASLHGIKQQDLKEFAVSWCSDPKGNVCICGPSGCGKSWAACAMLLEAQIPFVRFENIEELYSTWKELQGSDLNLAFKLVDVDLLLLDDLGTTSPSEKFLGFLYSVINGRSMKRKPMIVTSNLLPAQMLQVLGDRITTRVCHGYFYSMQEKNQRQTIVVNKNGLNSHSKGSPFAQK